MFVGRTGPDSWSPRQELGHLIDSAANNHIRFVRAATEPEFSGPGYRVINFVADLPVRIDSFVCRAGDPLYGDYGQIVFVLTEFQIVDQAISITNEQGENSHQRYKERQHARVPARLTRGLKDATATLKAERSSDKE